LNEIKKSVFTFFFITLFLALPMVLVAQDIKAEATGTYQIEPDFVGLVTIRINSDTKGDFEIGILEDNPILETSLLQELIGSYLRPDIYDTIFNTVFYTLAWVTEEEINLVGIGWEWDMANIRLTLRIPPSYSPVIDIDTTAQSPVNIKPILKPSAVSGKIDFKANASAGFTTTSVEIPLEASISGSINILSWISIVSGSMRHSEGAFSYSLNNAYILHDFPGISARFSAGRVFSSGLSYQTQPELYGFTLKSEQFQRYRVKPGYNELFSEFTIDTPSTVRIKLNDAVYKTLSMMPGNYRLLDLPFTYGLNEFVLEIEDSNGNITTRRAVIPREMNLLVEGLSDYAISAGVGRVDIAQPFLSGYYRKGFSPRLTAGFMAQADLRSTLAGLTFVYASSIGSWTGTGATVVAWDGRAKPWTYAGSLQYRLVLPGKSFAPSVGFSTEFMSDNFSAPSVNAYISTTARSLRLSGQLGGRILNKTSYSLASSWTKIFGAGGAETTSLSLSINRTMRQGANFSAIANASFSNTLAPRYTITFLLFVLPKDKPGRSMSFIQTAEGNSSISFVDKLNILGGVDMNLRASNLIIGSGRGSNIGITGRKATDFGDFSAGGDFEYGNSSSTRIGTIRASASSTIAFVNRYISITRSLDDSFVILVPDKDMVNEKVYMRIDGSGSVISLRSRPVVLPISSYKPTVAYLDMPEASPDILPRYQAALLVPAYKSGLLYQTDILRRYLVTGRLIDVLGSPIGYVAGDITDLGGSNIISTFTDEQGYFEVYDLLPGEYTINWPESIGTSSFLLEETPLGELTLGDVVARPNELSED
jgi:outer membrane usher protein FimD/PapC